MSSLGRNGLILLSLQQDGQGLADEYFLKDYAYSSGNTGMAAECATRHYSDIIMGAMAS